MARLVYRMEKPDPFFAADGPSCGLSGHHGFWWNCKMGSSTSAVMLDAEDLQDAPQVPPESISYYSYKRAASDIKELARQLGAPRIVLGGHDWYAGEPIT